MKYLFFSLIVLYLLFAGCSKNNPTEPPLQSDSELKSNIIGTWSNAYVTISYNEDGSFFWTINYIIYSDSSTTPPEAIQGTYDIKNGILIYQVSEWKIFNKVKKRLTKFDRINSGIISNEMDDRSIMEDSDNELWPIYSIPDFRIQFQGDLLYNYPLSILISTGASTDGIWGEWSTTHWAIGSGLGIQDSLVLGKLGWRYNFDKSSMMVSYGFKFLIDSLGTFYYQTDTVKYNPPDLSWGYNYKKTIEFHNGQMYMFEKLTRPTIPLKRIE